MTDDEHLLTTPEIKRRYATFLRRHGVDPRVAMDSASLPKGIGMTQPEWAAGTEVHVIDHPSVLNDLNAYVLDDDGQEAWIVIAHGSHNDKNTIVPNGSRHVLPRKHLAEGLTS